MNLPPKTGIIALDNGSMCGIALWATRFASSEFLPHATLTTLQNVLKTPNWKWLVVAERWDAAGRTSRPMTAQVTAIETNGAARWISEQCNATFGLQSRGEAKKVMSDTTLRRIGWFKKTKDGHANDAARHLGLALLHHFPVEYMKLTELI